ncbi:MAG: hypothetical protein QOF73_333, partial [Thermomicrobiales bacterium]|nr:hypothetical protein [Thermomicrobiales bacterium]
MSEPRRRPTSNQVPTAPDVPELSGVRSAHEVAADLGVSERTIRRAIQRGGLRATKQGRVYHITQADVDAYQARHARGPRRKPVVFPSSPPPFRLVESPAIRLPPLPVPLTSLVGREMATADLVALLERDDVPLVTLTGPGGVGKTRLVLVAGRAAADAFADGVAFVALAPINDPALVLPAIAAALGVREVGERSLASSLAVALRNRQLLLILDNFEHVLDAAPGVVELLAACPQLTVLVTSRAPLRVSGEHEVPVPPLALPDRPNGAHRRSGLEEVAQSEAVRLFVPRAQAIRPDFALTPSNADTVVTICRRLDGLPLAIELAAARIRLLPPEALLGRLSRRLDLLAGGPRDQPLRLQTLRNAVGWSHDLLREAERALFRQLSVFTGGFTLEAAGPRAPRRRARRRGEVRRRGAALRGESRA